MDDRLGFCASDIASSHLTLANYTQQFYRAGRMNIYVSSSDTVIRPSMLRVAGVLDEICRGDHALVGPELWAADLLQRTHPLGTAPCLPAAEESHCKGLVGSGGRNQGNVGHVGTVGNVGHVGTVGNVGQRRGELRKTKQ